MCLLKARLKHKTLPLGTLWQHLLSFRAEALIVAVACRALCELCLLDPNLSPSSYSRLASWTADTSAALLLRDSPDNPPTSGPLHSPSLLPPKPPAGEHVAAPHAHWASFTQPLCSYSGPGLAPSAFPFFSDSTQHFLANLTGNLRVHPLLPVSSL